MSRPVIITPLAEADIANAQDDYESREPGLGNRVVIACIAYRVDPTLARRRGLGRLEP